MPWKPKRPCAGGCGVLVDQGRCSKCSRLHEQERRPVWVTTFYSSTAWKKVRARRRRENPFCQEHQARGIGVLATSVDHRIPLEDRPDLALDYDNTRSLCAECHNAKTRAQGGAG